MSNRISMDKTGAPQIEAGETDLQPEVRLHPVAVEIGIGAALWFVAMAWLDFARDGEIDYLLAIVTLFFVMFFTLFLLTASYSAHDPRWPSRDTSFREFLRSSFGDGDWQHARTRGVDRDRAAPGLALAFAATLIGSCWVSSATELLDRWRAAPRGQA